MSESHQDQNPEFVHRAFSSIAGRYVFTNHVLSGGIDILWRRKVSKIVAASAPMLVVDVATGSGDLAAAVGKRSPRATIIGADFCAPMLDHARRRGLPHLIVADGMELPFAENSVDAITIGYGLRNMKNWAGALAGFARVLRPGGKLVILDFSLPERAWLRGPYRFYLHRVLPNVAALLTGNREAYTYLGESIERFPSGDAMCRLIQDNGFCEVECQPLLGGVSSVYVASTPEDSDLVDDAENL